MKHLLSLSAISAAISAVVSASSFAADFDFNDPKGVNTIVFSLDSELEPIMGTADGITGVISFDPAAADSISGSLSFPTKSLSVPNARMTGVMHGEDWLNADKNENVSFVITSVSGAKTEGNTTSVTLTGDMTVAGVTKSLTTPASFTHVAGGAKARGAGDGDLLVLRTKFSINRSDYGIKPGVVLDKVAETVELSVAIVGYPKK